MRSLRALAASSVGVGSIMAAGISGSALAQDAVQWRIEDGGNGHWYAKTTQVFAHFSFARAYAEANGGHLATLPSASENSFVASLAPGDAILGGYQDRSAANYVENAGGWRWVTGEPWKFTSWNPGEPNNGGWPDERGEHYLLWSRYVNQYSSTWNDGGNDMTIPPWNGPWNLPAMIEWSADCNADGIVDYGQIRAGELADTNANNIPDCCESAAECPDSTPAVQWSTQNGGNGHWYSLRVDPLVPIEHFNPRCEAIGGHLASIVDPSEHAFVLQLMVTQGWLGIAGWPAIGLQRSSDSAPWQWVTGEATAYLPWAPGEPGAGGRFAQLWGVGQTPNLTWSANGNSFISVGVIEWSADCNADGIVDYGQIRAGELADANANNIPDCCEAAEGCNPCLADIDESGVVNAVDLAAILTVWGTSGGKYPRADINNDGEVNGPDLAAVLSAWGPCP